MKSTVASPRRFVVWQPTELTCERCRSNTSTVASMSPPASSATSRSRGFALESAYQTEPFGLRDPQDDGGSSASTVDSTVVPLIVAGSAPTAAGALRASFGGGAALAAEVCTSRAVRSTARTARLRRCVARVGGMQTERLARAKVALRIAQRKVSLTASALRPSVSCSRPAVSRGS